MVLRKQLLSVKESASFLGVHPQTIRRWAAEGRIPHMRVGARLRFRIADLERWAEGAASASLRGSQTR